MSFGLNAPACVVNACFGLPGCVSVWFRCHLSSIVLSIRSVDVHMLVFICMYVPAEKIYLFVGVSMQWFLI